MFKFPKVGETCFNVLVRLEYEGICYNDDHRVCNSAKFDLINPLVVKGGKECTSFSDPFSLYLDVMKLPLKT